MKSQELQAKNDFDQQDAEKQKAHSQEIRAQVERQKGEIAQQTEEVQEDLDKVEPAVIEAQQAVKMIKKQNLVEIRSMSNPPPIIKMALESVCLLLGENATDWKAIRGVIIRDNFISTIVNFDADDISDHVREQMKARYLSNPDYTYEKVNR